MAFVIADRVRETSTTIGTGNFTLAGAVTGYQTFDAALDTGDTTYYTIADQSGANWEVGIGTFTSPSTLARTTILSSSNGGSVVTFGAGTKDVFISLPASKTNVEDQPNLIEVNSSSAALRITQTGAGNALVVEDSANPDATPFVVNASGNVGIGTSSPGTTRLYISANRATDPVLQTWDTFNGATFENSALLSYDGTKTYFYNFQANPLAFGTNNAERMRIDASGNVGIGTSSPSQKLTVVDATSANLLLSGSTTNYITYAYSGFAVSGTASNTPWLFYTNNTERMRLDTSGNVGIGTSSPGSTLDVNGAITGRAVSGEGGELRLNNPTNASVGMYVDVSSADSGRVFSVSNNFTLSLGQLGGTGGNVLLYTAATERFRVGPSGQFGINGANYGTSGQVLTSNGSGSAPSWQTASSTGALKNVQVFTSSGTYTRTSGVTTAVVVAVGGGGGAKGSNGAGGGGNGGNGGTTSFGAHVTAAGGTGATSASGGAGGTGGTSATIALAGQGGGSGNAYTGGGFGGIGGGQGGGRSTNTAAGVAGVRGGGGSGGSGFAPCVGEFSGGGGGQGETAIKYITTVGATETVTIGAGGTAGTGSAAGGAGGAGYIIVYEYS